MYDPSYFVEREQYIARVQQFVNDNFEGKLHEAFMEVTGFYEVIVDLAREYETCLDERKKKRIARRYEKAARLLQKYLDVMKKTMDETEDGVDRLEECYDSEDEINA